MKRIYLMKSKSMNAYLMMVLVLPFLLLSIPGFSQSIAPGKIIIKAVSGLQYDVVRFQVMPGQEVDLLFQNTDDMDHNLIITLPDAREVVVNKALELGAKGLELGFIPESDKIVQSIGTLSPGEEKRLTFIAPKAVGIYPYVCTYPGHGAIMYGAMYVTEGPMPPLEDDNHIPPHRQGNSIGTDVSMKEMHHNKRWHPYDLKAPYLYRIFMPESGPASIAVHLPKDVSYCWDAALCRLRYIWSGDFLDISEPWTTKGDKRAKLLGKIFYREGQFPLQIGTGDNQVDYKGYRLIEGGYPEFRYQVNGLTVYELIRSLETGNGIVRRFRIPDIEESISFRCEPYENVQVESDEGEWSGLRLQLNAEEAKLFTITMIRESE